MSATLAESRMEAAHLQAALASNRRIGMAIGITMCQLHVTEQRAFEVLAAMSQREHRKLRDIAEDIIYTGLVPSQGVTDAAG